MTREQVETLEERVAEFGCLAEMIQIMMASTVLESNAVDMLHGIHLHLVHILDRMDALTVPARQILGGKA